MAFAWAVARKELARRRRDPLALALWAGIPLGIGLLMFLAFGRGGARPHGLILVDDRDGSFVSRLVSGAFDNGELSDLFDVERVDPQEGERRIEDGDASALLVIPAGFGQAVLAGTPTRLTLVENPSQQILPRIAEEAVGMLVDVAFYLQRLGGPILSGIAARSPRGSSQVSDSTVAATSVAINQLVARVRPYLFPPAIDLQVLRPVEEEEVPFALLFFPSMLVLALLFVAQGLSEEVWRERGQRTLHRLMAAPRSLASLLAGHLLGGAVVAAVVAGVGLVAGSLLFEIPPAAIPLALAWAVATGVALHALMILIQVHASSERGGNVLTGAILFPLAMAGGSFFPFEIMPDWLVRVGRWTPNGWALTRLVAILHGTAGAEAIAVGLLGLATVTVACLFLALRRMRRAFLTA